MEEGRVFSKPLGISIGDIETIRADKSSNYNRINGQKNSKGSAITRKYNKLQIKALTFKQEPHLEVPSIEMVKRG